MVTILIDSNGTPLSALADATSTIFSISNRSLMRNKSAFRFGHGIGFSGLGSGSNARMKSRMFLYRESVMARRFSMDVNA